MHTIHHLFGERTYDNVHTYGNGGRKTIIYIYIYRYIPQIASAIGVLVVLIRDPLESIWMHGACWAVTKPNKKQ